MAYEPSVTRAEGLRFVEAVVDRKPSGNRIWCPREKSVSVFACVRDFYDSDRS